MTGSLVRRVAAVLLALGLLAGRPAAAQETEGQRLFREGREAMERGEVDAACARFAASHAAEGAVGPLLNLANCEEKRGQIGSALEAWRRARGLAREDQVEQRRLADERIAALEPRVPTLLLRPGRAAAASMRVTLDDAPLEVDGVARTLNPGKHRLEVAAAGRATATREIQVGEGDRLDLVVEPGPAASEAPPAPPPPSDDGAGPAPLLVGGIVAGGVGVLGLGVFAVTGLMALDAQATLEEACGEDHLCPADDTAGRDAADRGESLVVPNAVGLGVGITGLAVGAALVFLHLSGDDAATTFAPRPSGGGFVGRF